MRWSTFLAVVAVASTIAHGALAVCPTQPAPPLDLSDGTVIACLRSTPDAVVRKLEIRFIDALGQPAVVTVLPTPPATAFPDDSRIPVTVPAHIRGSGPVVGATINEYGEGLVTVTATFRPGDRPAAPVLLEGP